MNEKYLIDVDGELIEVETIQDVYVDGVTKSDKHYKAMAIDKEGCKYMLRWEIKDTWNWENEDEACEWENISAVTVLGVHY